MVVYGVLFVSLKCRGYDNFFFLYFAGTFDDKNVITKLRGSFCIMYMDIRIYDILLVEC